MTEEKRGSAEESGFKITDKRHFTSDGEVIPGDDRPTEEEPAAEERAAPPPPPPAPEPPSAKPTSPVPPAEGDAGGETPGPETGEDEKADFSHLVLYLANITSFALGVPDPVTGKAEVNLEAASQMIDMVVLLQEKTRGNLTAREEEVLTAVLSELKTLYVRASGMLK
jgi:hypothetical protein